MTARTHTVTAGTNAAARLVAACTRLATMPAADCAGTIGDQLRAQVATLEALLPADVVRAAHRSAVVARSAHLRDLARRQAAADHDGVTR